MSSKAARMRRRREEENERREEERRERLEAERKQRINNNKGRYAYPWMSRTSTTKTVAESLETSNKKDSSPLSVRFDRSTTSDDDGGGCGSGYDKNKKKQSPISSVLRGDSSSSPSSSFADTAYFSPSGKRKLGNTFAAIDPKWLDRKPSPTERATSRLSKKKLNSGGGDDDKPPAMTNNNNNTVARMRKPLGKAPLGKGNACDSSSSDDDDEMMRAFFTNQERAKKTSLDESSKINDKQQRSSLSSSCVVGDSLDDDENTSHGNQNKMSCHKETRRNHNNKSLMDDTSEEEEEEDTRRFGKAKRRNRVDDISSSDEEETPLTDRGPVLNPIILERLDRERLAAAAAASPPKAAGVQNIGDDLWDFSDVEETAAAVGEEEDDSTPKRKKARDSSKTKKRRSFGSTSQNSQKKTPDKKTPKQSLSDDAIDHVTYDDELCPIDKRLRNAIEQGDMEILESMAHPTLEFPSFTSEFEPLVMGDGEKRHSIPASVSRYLGDYQKEGVTFLHKCYTSRMGGILGDEMGLGKTVQAISLLCALYGKTGTGLDCLEITRRWKLVNEKKMAVQRERENAMLNGNMFVQQDIDLTDLNLPPVYPVLLIVPPSLVDNWAHEFRFWSHFSVAKFNGSSRDRQLEKLCDGRAEILIVPDSLFQKKETFQQLNEVPWKLVIIDEFHKFKNPKIKLSKNLRELKKVHRPLIISMTGTLMSNDHNELWNLVDLVETNYLGSWEEFKNETAGFIKFGRVKGADDDAKRRSAEKSEALNRKLSNIFIERTKLEVLSDKLPNKEQHVVFCEMSELQKQIYENVQTLPDVELVKLGNSPCDCGINQEFFRKYVKLRTEAERVKYCRENKKHIYPRKVCCYRVPWNPRKDLPGQPLINPDAVIWRSSPRHDEESGDGCDRCPYCNFFPILTKLNQLSSHAALLQAVKEPGWNTQGSEVQKKFEKDLDFAKVALGPSEIVENLPGGFIRHNTIMDNHFLLSGKLKSLHKLLEKFRGLSRVLIFSYSTKTLDLIQTYVQANGHSFLRIDGNVSASDRQRLVSKFQNDPSIFIFLLSTKAAGLGLNITAANKVIIFDVEWNPSWDKQAQDRAYRLGQRSDVQVYRLVTQGSVDELKYLRQLYKIQLKQDTLDSSGASAPRMFRAVQGDKERKGELFGVENLFKFKRNGSYIEDIWKAGREKHSRGRRKSTGLQIFKESEISSDREGMQICGQVVDGDSTESEILKVGEQLIDSQPGSVVGNTDNESQDEKKPTAENSEEVLQEVAAQDSVGEIGGETQNMLAVASLAQNQVNDANQSGGEENKGGSSLAEGGEEGSDEENVEDIGVRINHEHFFDDERGGAARDEGDEGYEEEMGGASQNIYDVLEGGNMQLSENPQDGGMDIDEGIDFDPASHNDDDRRQEPMNLHPDFPSSNPSLQQNSLNHAAQGINGQDVASIARQEDEKLSFFSSRTARRSQSNQSAEIEIPNEDGTDEGGVKDAKIKLEENGTDVRDNDAVVSMLEEEGTDERNKGTVESKPDEEKTDEGDQDAAAKSKREEEKKEEKGKDTEANHSDANTERPNHHRSPKKRPVALVGKTPSEIASKKSGGSLAGIKLPSYMRKKRKK